MTENLFLKEFLPYDNEMIKVINLTKQKGEKENKDTLYFLRGYYIFVNFLVAEKSVFNEMPDGFKMLLSKASLDLFAIYNTLSSGCMSQSLTLVRSLFESSVNLTYINRDFDRLMEYYLNHKDFLAYHKWIDEKELFNFPIEKEEEIVQKYESIKMNYNKRGPWYEIPLLKDMEEHRTFTHLKRKRATFKAMCIVTEQEEFYNRLYSTMSESVHGSSLIGSLFINEKNNISIAPRYDTFYIDSTSAFAIMFLHNMVSIGLKRQIEKGFTEYTNYFRYSEAYANQLINNAAKMKP